jgi:hypothetical protein
LARPLWRLSVLRWHDFSCEQERKEIKGILTERQHLEYHEAPGDNFSPAAFVSGLGEKVVPESLGVMLLLVKDLRGNLGCDMVLQVIA